MNKVLILESHFSRDMSCYLLRKDDILTHVYTGYCGNDLGCCLIGSPYINCNKFCYISQRPDGAKFAACGALSILIR